MWRLPSSHQRRTRALVAAAFLAAILAALPETANAADKGIDTDMTWGAGSQTTTANAMADLGARWTRVTLSWHDVETKQGQYSSSALSQVDTAISLSHARGIKVLVDVVEAPSWASGSSDKNTPPRSMGDFATFVGAMSARYAGQADAWEVWNEENTQRFWSTGVNPGQYAQMLAAAYPAIKAHTSVPVLFGGMARNDWDFLQSAYNAMPNLGSFYDVMATHPYPGGDLNAPPDLTIRNGDGTISQDSFNGYRQVHQTMLSHGDDKPIWLTEMGWSTWSGGVSAQTQAAYTTKGFQCLEQDSYVQIGFTYNIRNNYWANDANDWDDQLGLMYTNWSHKPAYDAYKAYTPGSGGCTYHEASGAPTPAGTAPPSTAPAAAPRTSTSASSTSSSSKAKPTTTTTTLRLVRTVSSSRAKAKAKAAGHSPKAKKQPASTAKGLILGGSVRRATHGIVVLIFERRVHGKWHVSLRKRARLSRSGRFQVTAFPRGTGAWKVRAAYAGSAQAKASRSRWISFKI